jgi:hypothetical protein
VYTACFVSVTNDSASVLDAPPIPDTEQPPADRRLSADGRLATDGRLSAGGRLPHWAVMTLAYVALFAAMIGAAALAVKLGALP